MRHGARTDLAGAQLLLEITQGHIAPDIARPVDQNRIGAGYRIEQLGHIVVRLDLNTVGLEYQAQATRLGFFHDAAGKAFPIKLGPGG